MQDNSHNTYTWTVYTKYIIIEFFRFSATLFFRFSVAAIWLSTPSGTTIEISYFPMHLFIASRNISIINSYEVEYKNSVTDGIDDTQQ
jgi:hypothetical protein